MAKKEQIACFHRKTPIGKLAGNIGMPKTANLTPFPPLFSHPLCQTSDNRLEDII
jgi:hypothetical protein